MEQRFNEMIGYYEDEIERKNKKSNILGIVKLVLFAALVFTGVRLCFTSNYCGGGTAGAVCLCPDMAQPGSGGDSADEGAQGHSTKG